MVRNQGTSVCSKLLTSAEVGEDFDGHLILRIGLLPPEIHFFPLDLIIRQDASMMNLRSLGSLEPRDLRQ